MNSPGALTPCPLIDYVPDDPGNAEPSIAFGVAVGKVNLMLIQCFPPEKAIHRNSLFLLNNPHP